MFPANICSIQLIDSKRLTQPNLRKSIISDFDESQGQRVPHSSLRRPFRSAFEHRLNPSLQNLIRFHCSIVFSCRHLIRIALVLSNNRRLLPRLLLAAAHKQTLVDLSNSLSDNTHSPSQLSRSPVKLRVNRFNMRRFRL
jgi:hypothetical protein